MKKCFILMAGVALMSAFTSCSNDDDVIAVADGEGTPLVIKSVGMEEVGTKAGILGTTFSNTAAIGVYLNNGNLNTAYNADGTTTGTENVSYTKGATNWTWGSNIMLSSTQGTVRAYYPYDSSYSGHGTDVPVNVSATQTSISAGTSDVADQKDYMYASKVSGISNAKGKSTIDNLKMNHALAMVTFKFKNSTTNPYVGAGKVSEIKLFNKAPETKAFIKTGAGTMNIDNGSIQINASAATAGITTTIAEASQSLKGVTDRAKLPHLLIYPQAVQGDVAAGDVRVTVTMDGSKYTLDLPALTGGFEKANNYEYEFTLEGTQLKITSVTINDWTPKPQTGGTMNTPVA